MSRQAQLWLVGIGVVVLVFVGIFVAFGIGSSESRGKIESVPTTAR
jgi:hypothetical protein